MASPGEPAAGGTAVGGNASGASWLSPAGAVPPVVAEAGSAAGAPAVAGGCAGFGTCFGGGATNAGRGGGGGGGAGQPVNAAPASAIIAAHNKPRTRMSSLPASEEDILTDPGGRRLPFSPC